MKTFKSFKKLALFGGLLLTTTAFTTLIAVSCSNTSDPQIAQAIDFNMNDNGKSHKITINKANVSVHPAVIIEGKEYITLPAINNDASKISLADQKARVYFTEITNFSIWLQSYISKTQDFLSAAPNSLMTFNSGFGPYLDLACALSAPLNEGADTARLGLRSVNFTFNLLDSINNNFAAYSADDVGKDWKKDWSETVTGINLKYNWWSTAQSNAINWKDDYWDVANQKSTLWDKLPSRPKSTYTLAFDNIGFDMTQVAVAKDAKWINNGVASFVNPSAAFKFDILNDKQVTQNTLDFLVSADKNKKGDVLHGSYEKFVTNPDQQTNLTNFLKVLK